jgi:hypothetical protein
VPRSIGQLSFVLTPKAFADASKHCSRRFVLTPKAFANASKHCSRRFVLTPKAFANFSPRLERSDYLGLSVTNSALTLTGVFTRRTLSGLKQKND